MSLEFKQATQLDLAKLTKIMTRAFDYDSNLYVSRDDGPRGYRDGSLAVRLLNDPNLTTYLICKEAVCGCLTFGLKEETATLELLCIDPAFIGQGIGTQAWQQLESCVACQKWLVETPDYSLRNHYFYQEKCGFRKITEKSYGTAGSFLFEKCRSTE